MTGGRRDAHEIERETRRKYTDGSYPADTLVRAGAATGDYFDRLAAIKTGLVADLARGRSVLDICCATGEHLLGLEGTGGLRAGADFSVPYLARAAATARERGAGDARFVCANARRLPFASGTFGLVYCFSSLYAIPRVDEALAEMARVLSTGGWAVFDLGNRWSLNTFVARADPDIATPCHVAAGRMAGLVTAAGFEIVERRTFQILPMWGGRPAWLRPLLAPFWKRLLARRALGKMLDEWISSLPGLRRLAFRHLFVCRKARAT